MQIKPCKETEKERCSFRVYALLKQIAGVRGQKALFVADNHEKQKVERKAKDIWKGGDISMQAISITIAINEDGEARIREPYEVDNVWSTSVYIRNKQRKERERQQDPNPENIYIHANIDGKAAALMSDGSHV